MAIDRNHIRELIDKLESLPPERIAEVEDFIDFLTTRSQDDRLTKSAMKASEPAFDTVWDNADDAVYDQL